MHEELPAKLVELLARLHLATAEQVQAVAVRARRLAFDLPLFESVWIDALAQARLLTPYQAAQINAGRGEQLLVGPYVIQKLVQRLGYADCFLAIEHSGASSEKKEVKKSVHLLVAHTAGQAGSGAGAEACLQTLVERFGSFNHSGVARLQAVGFADDRLWAAYVPPTGFPAIDWLSCQGRLSPKSVLEIARQMVPALTALESAGIVHGDISASSLWLSESGEIQLSNCGLRQALRQNGLERLEDLPLESLDYLAPELIDRSPALATSQQADFYACGCLWWHLLAGRPPLVGGDREAKLAAVKRAKIPDIRQIAPDVSAALAAAIEQCTKCDPRQRPQSFAELVEKLGPATRADRRALAAELLSSNRRTVRPAFSQRVQTGVKLAAQPLLAAAACAVLVAAATWPLWRPQREKLVSSPGAIAGSPSSGTVQKIVENDKPKPPTADPAIRQVNYQSDDKANVSSASNRPIIDLTGKSEITAVSLRLTPGAVVRGSESSRTTIAVPPGGLIVAADNVRFDNVDFVWRARSEEIVSPDRLALVALRSARAEFANCTFQGAKVDAFDLPTAIRLEGNGQNAALAPAARVKLDRCLTSNVACGIDCRSPGPAAIEINDTLHLGSGPLVRFPFVRRVDAPATIALAHSTIRAASAVLQLNCDNASDGLGTINVTATDCVFAPAEDGALVALAARGKPKSLPAIVKAIDWTGKGSLFDSHVAILNWQRSDAREALPEDDLPLDGLVASAFDFAGQPTSDPATSQLRKWAAPLESDQPPGIGEDLPKPSVKNSGR